MIYFKIICFENQENKGLQFIELIYNACLCAGKTITDIGIVRKEGIIVHIAHSSTRDTVHQSGLITVLLLPSSFLARLDRKCHPGSTQELNSPLYSKRFQRLLECVVVCAAIYRINLMHVSVYTLRERFIPMNWVIFLGTYTEV